MTNKKKEAKASLLILTQILILLYLLLDQTGYYYISIRFVDPDLPLS